jgi:hypothetical protein
MSTKADFSFRGMSTWRVTPDVDPSVELGRVVYRFDVGIRHERLIGYSVEANGRLLLELFETLLFTTRPGSSLHVGAKSWLEDLAVHASQARITVAFEGRDAGKDGYLFACECQPGEAAQLLTALWSWSSEFWIQIPASPPFGANVTFQMFPEHIDIVEISVAVRDEEYIRGFLSPAA